jgi:hypothetical protein
MKTFFFAATMLMTALAFGQNSKLDFTSAPRWPEAKLPKQMRSAEPTDAKDLVEMKSEISRGLVKSRYQGSEGVGGGDLCDDRVKIIRDDLRSWIGKGGAADLKLPRPWAKASYDSTMLAQIERAQVRCVSPGDAGYPVQINGMAKTCRFGRTQGTSLITCDTKKFAAIGESDQYVLIHHEYAGLAGIEKPNGADSDYRVSNLISGYLESRVVKQLVVKKREAPVVATGGIPELEVFKAVDLCFAKGEPGHPSLTQKLYSQIVGKNSWSVFSKYFQPAFYYNDTTPAGMIMSWGKQKFFAAVTAGDDGHKLVIAFNKDESSFAKYDDAEAWLKSDQSIPNVHSMSAKMVPQYDSYGSLISETRYLYGVSLVPGSTLVTTFRNLHTDQSVELTVDLSDYKQCLQNQLQAMTK